MEIRIYEELARAIGEKPLQLLSENVEFEKFSWQRYIELDLIRLEREQVDNLLELIKPFATKGSTYRGAQTLRDDIVSWLRAFDNPDAVRPRTCQHFCALVTEALAHVPGHRIYWRDPASDVWYAYYTYGVNYHPRYRESRSERWIPAHTDIKVVWFEFGGRKSDTIVFHDEDCIGISVLEALGRKGYVVETDELREKYLADAAGFNATVGLIGHQYLARGAAADNCDGNPGGDRWSSHSRDTVTLDRDGDPARVVIDVFYEKEDKEDRDEHFDRWFWRRHEIRLAKRKREAEALGKKAKKEEKQVGFRKKPEDDEIDDKELEDVYDKEPVIEVPLHPMLAVFDLRRQLRLRVHLGQLQQYRYDVKLGDKLVLPTEERKLVEMLVEHKGAFQDVIKGKGQGAVILCAGPPGTGKTLTAEVYCEVAQRPLYSVQCSQLGLNAEALEVALMKVFARSQRWNAILLLDEADVYVTQRGTDMRQNAIVGVFLRVLEYYKGVLFMTTNRADLVDDAIASRCIAKIPYTVPSVEHQARIWRVLADTASIKLSDADIKAITTAHHRLTGRDIKNLLKLAQLIRVEDKKRPMPEIINFVKRFKPTEDAE